MVVVAKVVAALFLDGILQVLRLATTELLTNLDQPTYSTTVITELSCSGETSNYASSLSSHCEKPCTACVTSSPCYGTKVNSLQGKPVTTECKVKGLLETSLFHGIMKMICR